MVRGTDYVRHSLIEYPGDPAIRLSDNITRNRSKSRTSESHHRIAIPRNVKEVQKLTGRVAALNRFISWSSDKCHLFYNVLRKNRSFLWMDEHENALQDLKRYMVSPLLLTKPVNGESLQLYLAYLTP
ncbi:hypothetical protein OSB04_028544 [Centaurea solstitialis]|uniref:Uncharacterized protein n=1 Tax=Centaurea solstitialis TaxID=347529 RepID=A0AA38SGP4_9ASTR|nr:hypothetical protein OSB04_028544 [Centaurea solstitialis]